MSEQSPSSSSEQTPFTPEELKRLEFQVFLLHELEAQGLADDTHPDLEDFTPIPKDEQANLPPLVRREPDRWKKINGIWYRL